MACCAAQPQHLPIVQRRQQQMGAAGARARRTAGGGSIEGRVRSRLRPAAAAATPRPRACWKSLEPAGAAAAATVRPLVYWKSPETAGAGGQRRTMRSALAVQAGAAEIMQVLAASHVPCAPRMCSPSTALCCVGSGWGRVWMWGALCGGRLSVWMWGALCVEAVRDVGPHESCLSQRQCEESNPLLHLPRFDLLAGVAGGGREPGPRRQPRRPHGDGRRGEGRHHPSS
jgi:hypothetical protein